MSGEVRIALVGIRRNRVISANSSSDWGRRDWVRKRIHHRGRREHRDGEMKITYEVLRFA